MVSSDTTDGGYQCPLRIPRAMDLGCPSLPFALVSGG